MHGLEVHMKNGLPFACDFSFENCEDSLYVFNCLYFIQCLSSFSSIDHHDLTVGFSQSIPLQMYSSL